MAELEAETNPPAAPISNASEKPEVDPKTKKFVTMWASKIKAAKGNKKIKEAFKRMDSCMQLAKDGASEDWIKDDKNYVVPIINRHINQAVAQLYAKNPKAYAKRKPRRMSTIWDGKMASLHEAGQKVAAAMAPPPAMVTPGNTMPAAPPMPPDPNDVAILLDAEKVKQYDVLMDGLAETMTILHNHYMQDQSAQYKQQFKALVRRAKVCGVGYVKLGFQRILEKNPDSDYAVKLTDATETLATMKQLIAEAGRDALDDESAEMEQLRTLIDDLQQESHLIVQEGPVLTFPKAKRIIIDPACVHLKTLAGAGWYAEEYDDKTPEEIEKDYGVDVTGNYSAYKPTDESATKRWNEDSGEECKDQPALVWRVMNRRTGQEFVICDGYDDYLKPPAPPSVKLRRFWDIFPLVFNEIESEDDLFPPSDVWLARHLAHEYNRSREGLREHRQMNRPGYLAPEGAFEETDLNKLESHATGAIITLKGIVDGKIQDKLMAKPVMQIDPKAYEVESIFSDLLRTVGSQQANLGPTEGTTATESSIAEQSRTVALADNVDDLDDLLSQLAQSTGEVMLTNISKETVVAIVGPGAVWPEMPETREEVAEEIVLDVRAGSSGRPNQAAELAKRERAMPFLLQLPNVNPIPMAMDYLNLLDIDAEGAIVEGLPSIQALNGMASKGPMGAGDPNAPGGQGGEGANNAPAAPGTAPGPAPTLRHYDHAGRVIDQ